MALPLPPGITPMPANPPAPLGDADPSTRARRIREAGLAWADMLKAYVDALWREYAPWERWRLGTATGLNTSNRTVAVDLDPGPASLEAVSINADWGRPKWTAAQIVGKRCRVLLDTQPNGSRRATVDDVVES